MAEGDETRGQERVRPLRHYDPEDCIFNIDREEVRAIVADFLDVLRDIQAVIAPPERSITVLEHAVVEWLEEIEKASGFKDGPVELNTATDRLFYIARQVRRRHK